MTSPPDHGTNNSAAGATLRSLDDLDRAGLLPGADVDALTQVAGRYAIAISGQLADLIARGDPRDPIAAQFVPTASERETRADERPDPIGDEAHSPCPGIVHRYPDRVLLKATAVCPVYCRFCFRREMVGPGQPATLSAADLERAIDYIAARPQIHEVIVTGGDPLALSPRRIGDLSARLAAIGHVSVVRWHTRVPVVRSDLVTSDLCEALALPLANDTAVFIAVHANSAREFTAEAKAACRALAARGIALAGQSVLLAGVNDSAGDLAALMRAMVATGIRPYYLHVLDKAPGTAHFRVPLARAQELMRDLRGHLSGLCLPTLMVEIPGGGGKVAAMPTDAEPDGAGGWLLRDRHGRQHVWHD